MDDKHIITLFEARSEDALKAVTDKYGRLCSMLARNITNSREDGEECVNDALLVLWKKIPPESPEPLAAYILRIVRNLAYKRLRHESAAKRSAGDVMPLDELCEVLTFDDNEADERELACAVDRFLSSLDERDRLLFMRRYWFNEPIRTLAEAFGMSESAVKVRLMRLRNRLREHLRKEGYEV